jgi:hypothetical protein
MLGRAQLLAFAVAIVAAIVPCRARQKPDSSRADENERTQRAEGQAIVAIADAAMNGDRVPSDIAIDWRNDFFKAQYGTFVPFAVTIDRAPLLTRSVLLYVRLAARGRTATDATIEPLGPPAGAPRSTPGRNEESGYAMSVEEVYAIELRGPPGKPELGTRGFSAQAGEYDLVVVVRERTDDSRPAELRRAGVLRRRLAVPDFPAAELSTSSIILADRLDVLGRPPPTPGRKNTLTSLV